MGRGREDDPGRPVEPGEARVHGNDTGADGSAGRRSHRPDGFPELSATTLTVRLFRPTPAAARPRWRKPRRALQPSRWSPRPPPGRGRAGSPRWSKLSLVLPLYATNKVVYHAPVVVLLFQVSHVRTLLEDSPL
jgi:hypothetical protein